MYVQSASSGVEKAMIIVKKIFLHAEWYNLENMIKLDGATISILKLLQEMCHYHVQ